ncbi:MAG: hypothetical protein ACLT9Y_02275 [Peptostreptococcus anaerobius]
MRLKKKIGSLVILTGMVSIMATGCGSSKSASSSWDSSKDISIISREDGSGTRGAFVELFKIEEKNEIKRKI